MKLLIDTHVFLWYITADTKLPSAFMVAIQDASNEVFLSVVSVWEAVIKHDLGKLSLPHSPADYLPHNSVLLMELSHYRWTRERCHIWPLFLLSTVTHSIVY
jgi:PIN domain nuclease of toxin-antitoxin system